MCCFLLWKLGFFPPVFIVDPSRSKCWGEVVSPPPRGGVSLIFPKVPQSSLGILGVPQLPPPLGHPPLKNPITMAPEIRLIPFFSGDHGGQSLIIIALLACGRLASQWGYRSTLRFLWSNWGRQFQSEISRAADANRAKKIRWCEMRWLDS